MSSKLLDFKPSNKFLRLKLNDYSYTSKVKKDYAYRLNNEQWNDLGENPEITLTNLPRGTNKLFIKSKLKLGAHWSKPSLIARISTTPPLLKRLEFWLFIGGLVGLIIYLGYRYRLRQFQEKQNLIIAFNKQIAETEMKALRAQMNPHFLFNVLNAIKLNVQKNNQEEAISFITDFSKLIRSVLQNSGKQSITLAEELDALELYVKIEKKRFDSSILYQSNINPDVQLKSIKIPPLLLQPYVENAIWHGILHKIGEQGKIIVSVEKEKNDVLIRIRDNGIGRKRANQLKLKSANKKKSMGMQITEDRMDINNRVSDKKFNVEIVDHYDELGNSIGTEAIIRIESIA